MKLTQFKGKLEDHLGITLVVLGVVVLLVLSLITPSFTAVAADEGEDKVGVPEWKAGERWKYSDRIPMPGDPGADPGEDDYIETIVEMEVTEDNFEEDFEVTAHGPDGEKKTYETYRVKETHNPDDPENRFEVDFYYWKENLAMIYNDPEGQVPSAYHPPVVELDFPLYVGKEWSTDPGYDSHYDLGRYFEDPPDLDDLDDGQDYPEPTREYAYFGRVEEKTAREIALERGTKEFETYMVNLTILAYDEMRDEAQLHRYEMHYSPEVKNLVHTDIFEVRAMPDDQGIGDHDDFREAPVGNETLLGYDAEPYEPAEEAEESLLGVGIVLVIIGVGTASIYIYKKVKSSF